MKIAVISPNPKHLADIGAVLEAQSHKALLYEGGKTRMREVAEREQPELMLVDGICCDLNELAHVEHVTTHHPATSVILLCASHTPEFLINSMRAGVREVLPSPASDEALLAAVDRISAKLLKGRPAPRGKVLAFVSCKGGSGATFLSTNLAWQLAETRSVLLIDLNLQFGDAVSFVHDGTPASTLADLARDIGRLDASLLAASTVKITPTYSVLAAPQDLAQAIEIKAEHLDAVLDLAVTQYDFVVLDVARNLDTIAIRAFDRATRIYGVMQTSLPDVRNASRVLGAFKALGYPADKCEILVNRYEKTAEIGLEQVQRSLGAVRVHTIPNAYKDVSASINQGDPLPRRTRGNAVARQLADMAQALSPRAHDNRGLLGRFFRRA